MPVDNDMPIEAKDDEDETAGALLDAEPSLGSCSLSEAAQSLRSMFQPEDVESEEKKNNLKKEKKRCHANLGRPRFRCRHC
jgi:hypothetical protein